MDTTIRDDFEEFIDNESLFNSDVKIYDSEGGSLIYDGKAIFDKKPQLVENENQEVFYQGHKSILSVPMSKLNMTSYSDIKGYYIEITYNSTTLKYTVANSSYSSNVDKVYCELKEVE